MKKNIKNAFFIVILSSLYLPLSFISPALAETGIVAGSWTEVPGAGISSGTGPAGVEFRGNLHLFITGGSDRVYTNVFQVRTNEWSGWSEVPGAGIVGGPGPTAVEFDDKLYLFIIGGPDAIYVNILNSFDNWSGWKEVPNKVKGLLKPMRATHGLTATTLFSNNFSNPGLALFARSVEGRIFVNVLRDNWSGWSQVPGDGYTTHGPAAVNNGDTYLLVRGLGGGIYENIRSFTSGVWTGWREVPDHVYATAAPGFSAPHDMLMVVRGLEGRIYQQYTPSFSQNADKWTEVPGDGRTTAGPAVVTYQGENYIFISGPNDRILGTISTR